jgi:RNA polymerase sigma-70 factor (ECF subfamily)
MNHKAVYCDINSREMGSTDSPYSDIMLLRQIAEGSESAFVELYHRYHVLIFNFVLRLIHDPKEAEDLLQEIFLAVWQGARRYREEAQVKTWIYRIAHYKAISWIRKHKPVISFDDFTETGQDGPEQEVFTSSQSDDLYKAINNLSVKHRAVLELAFVQGMAYGEIAKVIGCPIGTVKSRMSYALKALYGRLKRTDFE